MCRLCSGHFIGLADRIFLNACFAFWPLPKPPDPQIVSIQPGRFAAARTSVWNRRRFQLGIGLLLAVIAPWIVRVQVAAAPSELVGLQISVFGTTLALLAGYYSFSRLATFPGVRAAYHIFPTFAVSYGIVLAIFFFLRLDYSRLQFLSSFLLCLLWYHTVHFRLQRQHRMRVAVVPFGETASLDEIAEVQWVRLSEPRPGAERFDAIVADLRANIPDEWERFLADRALAGTLVMHVKQLQESLTGRVAIEHLSENNLGSLIPGIVYAKAKQLGDLIATLLLLPVLVPLMLVVALAIRLDSPGPVFFRQQRMGYRGHTFNMFKFRSMTHRVSDAEDPRDEAVTREGDQRVTRVGRLLRRYRIDELPQAINILRGEMSWIGPRPEAVPLSLWYESELPFYRYRHIVRPGITGWAQVNQGHVADVDEVLGKLHYDFYYIKNFSFWMDLLILARTVRTVLTGFGAR
jgi:lipopolysaccharide/colanic/teichoic acid biosynthesis glycosyltransferase